MFVTCAQERDFRLTGDSNKKRKKEKGKRKTIYLSRRAAGTVSEQPGCRRSGNSRETCGALLHILQRGVIFLAGADLDHAGHVVDKDLAIADMAGVQRLLGGLHHGVHTDAGDDDLHLDLRQQGGIHRHAAVLFRGTLLDAAAHDLRYGHAGDAQIIQGSLELIELSQLCNDGWKNSN